MLSMRDVAERAKVSRATVSVVLGGRAAEVGVSEETQNRVLAAAHELGYKRNALASAVVSGRSRMLGFLVPHLGHEPAARMLAGALDEAQERDHTLKVLRLRDETDDEADEENQSGKSVIERCLELRLSGVIVVESRSALLEQMRHEMDKREVPITILGTRPAHRGAFVNAFVSADEALGLRLVVEHLRALGHARIAFIGHTQSAAGKSAVENCEASFRAAMREQRLSVARGFVEQGQGIEATIAATLRLLRLRKPPSAIVCARDEMALSACRAARSMGKRVPHDVSIVGVGDVGVAALCDPPLCTLSLPFEAMGALAVRRTLERVDSPFHHDATEDLLAPRLVVRESTAAASPA